MQKYQNCKSIWRDEYVVVDANRLWFYQLNENPGFAYSSIDITDSTKFSLDDNIISITTTIHDASHSNKVIDPAVVSDELLIIKLRARNELDAKEWMLAIQSRHSCLYDTRNFSLRKT